MNYINVGKENSADINLYYKDWGKGRPVVFSHGWPLSADAWEDQMLFLGERGYRVIAHDLRGHGLKKFNVPTLIIHGDDDQIVPIGASALLSSKIVKGSTLKIYKGGSHGICSTNKDEINADLLAFLKS